MWDNWQATLDQLVQHGSAGREPDPDGSWGATVSGAPGGRGALLARAPAPFRTALEATCERVEGGGVGYAFGVDVCASERALVLWRESDEGAEFTLSVYPNLDAFVDAVLGSREWFDEEQEALEESAESE